MTSDMWLAVFMVLLFILVAFLLLSGTKGAYQRGIEALEGADALTCDTCHALTANPWHSSSGDNRHYHECDSCHRKRMALGGHQPKSSLLDTELRVPTPPRLNGDEVIAHELVVIGHRLHEAPLAKLIKTTEQRYEELRELIDGGSESMTHADAVKELGSMLQAEADFHTLEQAHEKQCQTSRELFEECRRLREVNARYAHHAKGLVQAISAFRRTPKRIRRKEIRESPQYDMMCKAVEAYRNEMEQR